MGDTYGITQACLGGFGREAQSGEDRERLDQKICVGFVFHIFLLSPSCGWLIEETFFRFHDENLIILGVFAITLLLQFRDRKFLVLFNGVASQVFMLLRPSASSVGTELSHFEFR